jgi:hypothetical protein
MKLKAIEAYKILNDILADLVIGTRSVEHLFNLLQSVPRDESYKIGVTRLCAFHIILSLTKYIEFYQHYKNVIPVEVRGSCKDLMKNLKNKKIVEFRNKVVGHVWDKDKRAPITDEEHDNYIKQIYGGNFESFLLWVNNPGNNIYPKTVVSIVEYTKNKIAKDYSIIDAEVFKN